MFCLFRNTQIHPKLNRYAIFISLLAVVYWLHFSFIEKSLFQKVFAGQAVIVDLVFGLPLVLALAVVVYASVYWFLKLLVIYLFPQAIVHIQHDDESLNELLADQELETLEDEHGKAYWQDETAEPDPRTPKQSDQPNHQ